MMDDPTGGFLWFIPSSFGVFRGQVLRSALQLKTETEPTPAKPGTISVVLATEDSHDSHDSSSGSGSKTVPSVLNFCKSSFLCVILMMMMMTMMMVMMMMMLMLMMI